MFLLVDNEGIVVAGHSNKIDADTMSLDYRAIYNCNTTVMTEDEYVEWQESYEATQQEEKL